MHRPICRLLILAAACVALTAPAAGAQTTVYSPGAVGIGDPYFPFEGNGGYDAQHYDLSFSYDPATDRLDALNKITARATQNLSRFDLDLQQLTVKGVEVNDRAARFTRDGQELIITPSKGIALGSTFTVNVRYAGVP
jgi:opacity protein-like surface antigen